MADELSKLKGRLVAYANFNAAGDRLDDISPIKIVDQRVSENAKKLQKQKKRSPAFSTGVDRSHERPIGCASTITPTPVLFEGAGE